MARSAPPDRSGPHLTGTQPIGRVLSGSAVAGHPWAARPDPPLPRESAPAFAVRGALSCRGRERFGDVDGHSGFGFGFGHCDCGLIYARESHAIVRDCGLETAVRWRLDAYPLK